jgi:hypothetical protein
MCRPAPGQTIKTDSPTQGNTQEKTPHLGSATMPLLGRCLERRQLQCFALNMLLAYYHATTLAKTGRENAPKPNHIVPAIFDTCTGSYLLVGTMDFGCKYDFVLPGTLVFG